MSRINDSGSLLGTKVYYILEKQILEGTLKTGENLKEMDVSAKLGVSRTPVREALRQLEIEGLVNIVPNRGAQVTGISQKDLFDVYDIRIQLEGLAVRKAAPLLTESGLDELKKLIDLIEFYTLKGDTPQLEKVDFQFHQIIYDHCGSRILKNILTTMQGYIKYVRNKSYKTPGRAEQALEEHKAILNAFETGNIDLAADLSVCHVKAAKENLLIEINEEK